MKIRVGKIIGICFAVSMIIVGSSFLVVNMIKTNQDLSIGYNATYFAAGFGPVGYMWSDKKDHPIDPIPLCRIYDIRRESSGGKGSPSKKIDLNADDPAINTIMGDFKHFESFDDLEKYLLEATGGQLVEVTSPASSIKINNGNLVLFFECVSQINADKESKIAELENQIMTIPSKLLDNKSYSYLKSGSGFVRFKLYMSTTTGHFTVYFTYANNPDYSQPVATDVEIQ